AMVRPDHGRRYRQEAGHGGGAEAVVLVGTVVQSEPGADRVELSVAPWSHETALRGSVVVTATKLERRKLTFATLDDVVRDAENLLAKGYDKAGNWDLAQVCSHLAEWMRFPMDGFPKIPLLLRPMFWLVRATVGKKMREKVLAEGFSAGGRTMPQ